MKRRDSLKKLVLASGGLLALPSWAKSWSSSRLETPTLLDQVEKNTLSAIIDTILPGATDSDDPGALDLEVEKFVEKLLQDCYEVDDQENVRVQLNRLDQRSQSTFQKTYSLCDPSERMDLFMQFSISDDPWESEFYELIKSETIRGYRTSEIVMTQYLDYQVAPGHYYGCVDITT